MRCHICDRDMSEPEVQYIPETETFDCCSVCLEIAMDAAYCDGFVKEESSEEVETLDNETYYSEVEIISVDKYYIGDE